MSAISQSGLYAGLLADHVRAAFGALFDVGTETTGVQARSALNLVEERLRPYFEFRSSFFEQLFELEADQLGRTQLADVLATLVSIGDLVHAGGSRYFPAPNRCVQLPNNEILLISGSPTDELQRQVKGTIIHRTARLVTSKPTGAWIESRLVDWLGIADFDYAAWTDAQLRIPLPALSTDATAWEFAKLERYGVRWDPCSGLSAFGKPLIVRYKNESTGRFVRLVAILEKRQGAVACTRGRSLSHHECSRLLNGLRLRSSLPRVQRIKRVDGDWALSMSPYALPEQRLILEAISAHKTTTENYVTLHFPVSDAERVESLSKHFGIQTEWITL